MPLEVLRERLIAEVEGHIDIAALRRVQTVEEQERKQIRALLSEAGLKP
jgi:hypothetical protein